MEAAGDASIALNEAASPLRRALPEGARDFREPGGAKNQFFEHRVASADGLVMNARGHGPAGEGALRRVSLPPADGKIKWPELQAGAGPGGVFPANFGSFLDPTLPCRNKIKFGS